MFSKQTVRDIDVSGKRALVRVDFNIPLSQGTVTDDTRIRAALPTINYLTSHGAKVILISHLGRPEGGGFDERFSLAPAARVLSRLIGQDVPLVCDLVGEQALNAAQALEPGQVLMLENTRFDKRDKKNDPELSQAMSKIADFFVNDAFGTAHRAHCSTEGVSHYLPSVAGLLLEKEVDTVTNMIEKCERPFVAVLGGSKVSDKIGVITSLLDKVDALLIGGAMCFTFLKAKGLEIGKSRCEEDWVERAGDMLALADEKHVDMLLPTDVVCAKEICECDMPLTCPVSQIPPDMMGLDIGPATAQRYVKVLQGAKSIFWNGPMGVYEVSSFEGGTRGVAEAISHNSSACSIIGGGDSVAAVKRFELQDGITFISTGGGASMELVEGKKLPGVECLIDKEA